MSDQRIDDTITFRRHKHGEPGASFQLVIGETVSPPLSDAALGTLAYALIDAYFRRTGRVVWPCAGMMLHHYEKEQKDAEARHLEWLRSSPAKENRAAAPAFAAAVGLPSTEDEDLVG